ncbi:MAG: hypothetical protein E7378_03705 [Clostridiales bacterium]|nr:hypothetical protein [Clostridiales bacterium]
MLFDKNHLIFLGVSFAIIIATLIICYKFVKQEKHKNLILKIASILTVAIHFSSLYVDYFTTGKAEVESVMLIPIYPCNIVMWLLLILAFMKNKQGKAFKGLAVFSFYLGMTGGLVGLLCNEIYASDPNMADWGVLKGLVSHVVLIFNSLYLLVGGYIKIRVKNVISVAIGLCGMIVEGGIVIGLYKLCNLDPPNSMYLLESPFASAPWINPYLIGVVALVLVFVIGSIVEQIALKKEDRWYKKIKEKKQ